MHLKRDKLLQQQVKTCPANVLLNKMLAWSRQSGEQQFYLIQGYLHCKSLIVLISDCTPIYIEQHKAAMVCDYTSALVVNLLQMRLAESVLVPQKRHENNNRLNTPAQVLGLSDNGKA